MVLVELEYIYDLSLGGVVYSKAQVNEALKTEILMILYSLEMM